MSAYERRIKTLKNLKKFELINRLLCYACVIPFFYTASCLGQNKTVPLTAKVGTIAFGATIITALAIKSKQEKTTEELEKIAERKRSRGY